MWITMKTDYATRAILALTLAGPGESLRLADIAERTSVPPSFLEQILGQLRGAGVVRSERGPAGGYRLNHAPEEITLDRIVRIFQGQLAPIACATRTLPEPCPMDVECSLREIWQEVRDVTIATLERVDFATLAAKAGGRWVEPAEPPAKPSKESAKDAAE